MRRYAALVFCVVLLTVGIAFAQTSRDGTSSEGKSTFTNIAAVGLNKNGSDGNYSPGLPGYIEMVSSKGDTFYLYIGYDGKLRIASDIVMGLNASPTTISWRDASGKIVGTQQ